MASKSARGQFYTTAAAYICAGLSFETTAAAAIEPFAGRGDLVDLARREAPGLRIAAFDLEPARADIVKRDTLRFPPDYSDAFVVTNPPYLAKNKVSAVSAPQDTIDAFGSHSDLFRVFIAQLCDPPVAAGGIVIVPTGFLTSPRAKDAAVRARFMENYTVSRINFFEERVFADTSSSVVAIAFARSAARLSSQSIDVYRFPGGACSTLVFSAAHRWIAGGEIYDRRSTAVACRRHVAGVDVSPTETLAPLKLCALDGGTPASRIRLEVVGAGAVYVGLPTSRAYASVAVKGIPAGAVVDYGAVARSFNAIVDSARRASLGMCLPSFREAKGGETRRRIPFDLAFEIIADCIYQEYAHHDARSIDPRRVGPRPDD